MDGQVDPLRAAAARPSTRRSLLHQLRRSVARSLRPTPPATRRRAQPCVRRRPRTHVAATPRLVPAATRAIAAAGRSVRSRAVRRAAARTRPPEPRRRAPRPEPIRARRSPGAGLWVGAAATLVVVLVLGAFLLLHGGGGSDTSSSPRRPPLSPKPTPHDPSAHDVGADLRDLVDAISLDGLADRAGHRRGGARAGHGARAHAPAGVDFAGRPVTYVAPNMVDGACRHLLAHAGRRERHRPHLPARPADRRSRRWG